MKIGLSTSVIQCGRSGVGQYVLSLVRALLPAATLHEFTLFVLDEDLPLFGFAAGPMRLEPVAERYRPPVRNILWHQTVLPRLVRRAGLDVLHVPSYRRMLWPRPCALVATIHDLAPFQLAGKYDWARMFYGRVIARQLARRQNEIVAVSRLTAGDIGRFFRVPSGRVTVVPNGLDHGQFRPGPPSRARAAGLTRARDFDWRVTATATLGGICAGRRADDASTRNLPTLGSVPAGEQGVHFPAETGARGPT
ncbi:MAG: glycosyltransferase, partial [Verrucomicrobia bacterium]|nr:glycosyltransferase [Verrucomicrobiota bacterium]